MKKPIKKLPKITDEYFMLSELIEYWKSKGATEQDEQLLFNRLNIICYNNDSFLTNGLFDLNIYEDAEDGSFDALLLDEFPEECEDYHIQFWVDTE